MKNQKEYYYAGKRLSVNNKLLHMFVLCSDESKIILFNEKLENNIIGSIHLITNKDSNVFSHISKLNKSDNSFIFIANDKIIILRQEHVQALLDYKDILEKKKLIKDLKSLDNYENLTLKEFKKLIYDKNISQSRALHIFKRIVLNY